MAVGPPKVRMLIGAVGHPKVRMLIGTAGPPKERMLIGVARFPFLSVATLEQREIKIAQMNRLVLEPSDTGGTSLRNTYPSDSESDGAMYSREVSPASTQSLTSESPHPEGVVSRKQGLKDWTVVSPQKCDFPKRYMQNKPSTYPPLPKWSPPGEPAHINASALPQLLPQIPLPRPPPKSAIQNPTQKLFTPSSSRDHDVEKNSISEHYVRQSEQNTAKVESMPHPPPPWGKACTIPPSLTALGRVSKSHGAGAVPEAANRQKQPLCAERQILAQGVGQFDGWLLLHSKTGCRVYWHHPTFGSKYQPVFHD